MSDWTTRLPGTTPTLQQMADQIDVLTKAHDDNQVPTTMAVLLRKLEQSWQPNAGTFLQPGSVTTDLLGLPLTTYTPVWASTGVTPAIGNGTLVGKYIRIGGLVYAAIDLVAGSTTTFGTGFYNFTLPVAAAAGIRLDMSGVLTDTGVQSYDINGTIVGGTSFNEILAASNAAGPTNWGATNPFTFGSTDRISISGVYAAL